MTVSDAVSLYVSRKQSLGAPYVSGAVTLKAFARFCGGLKLQLVNAGVVSDFLSSTESSAITRQSKFSAVKGFVEHYQARGVLKECRLISPAKPSSHRAPYIFSLEEIRKLIGAAELCQMRASGFDGRTFRMTLLMLYATGASLHEVIALRRRDIDVIEKWIVLGALGSRRKRVLPIGESLSGQLARYLSKSHLMSPETHLLCSSKGSRLDQQNLSARFKRLQMLVGVVKTKGRPQRLQDLRYTFAVHRLRDWILAGDNLNEQLPALSSYMGYASLTAAEQFLAYTPERFRHDLNKLSPNKGICQPKGKSLD